VFVSGWQLALLCAVGFVAGAIDAIAGGGGLLTVPVFLAVGLPEHQTLGTNKGAMVFGAFASLARYARAGLIDWRLAAIAFPAGFAGSLVGATAVLGVDRAVLRPLVIGMLLVAGAIVALRPSRPASAERPSPRGALAIVALVALVLGSYDGFFGPGAGTFLIIAFTTLLHHALPRATADAKVVNFASNLAAVTVFGLRGTILWQISLPMAAATFLGGLTGAQIAVKGGEGLIRKVVLGVVVALVAKLSWELVRS
jgi:uncharacterized protein